MCTLAPYHALMIPTVWFNCSEKLVLANGGRVVNYFLSWKNKGKLSRSTVNRMYFFMYITGKTSLQGNCWIIQVNFNHGRWCRGANREALWVALLVWVLSQEYRCGIIVFEQLFVTIRFVYSIEAKDMLRFVVGLLLPKPCRNFVQKKKREIKEKIVALICVSYAYNCLSVCFLQIEWFPATSRQCIRVQALGATFLPVPLLWFHLLIFMGKANMVQSFSVKSVNTPSQLGALLCAALLMDWCSTCPYSQPFATHHSSHKFVTKQTPFPQEIDCFFLFLKKENTGACACWLIQAVCSCMSAEACVCDVFVPAIGLMKGSPSKHEENFHLCAELTEGSKNSPNRHQFHWYWEKYGRWRPLPASTGVSLRRQGKNHYALADDNPCFYHSFSTRKPSLDKIWSFWQSKKLAFVEGLAKIYFWWTVKAGPSQVNFAETNPSKFGVCSSRTMQGSFSQALRTARRCGCDLRIDFLHLSQSGGRLIKFKNLNLHATLYHAVNVGERHFRQTFCPTSRSRERPCPALLSLVSCLFSLASFLAFSLFFFILSLVSPLPSVFSLVPSVVFRWTFV